ncbi:glycosyltransferase [uncultured Dubosiella sp.]|uniref:glycosyltransferase n=1 Tax=uncultured Dubosiella sp. TaxID=1937011 RepID=UPI002598FB1B|nr:glycosyltransferase [uncultured Dubosiella sp.]
MIPIYAILVDYNKPLETSPSYQALTRQKDIVTIVCDNSTKPTIDQKKVQSDGNVYLSMHGNRGLSKAYNRALDFIQEENPVMEGFVMLFDDDTTIPDDYFSCVRKAIRENNADIYLPLITDGHPEQGYLSPSLMQDVYLHRAKEPWKLSNEEICGINSGMVIRLSLFSDYRYNEDLFLDHVDHDFIRSMRKRNARIQILDTLLQQTFSAYETDGKKALKRFHVFKKDIHEFYKGSFKERLYCEYVILRHKASIFRHTKDWNIWLQ